LWCNCIYFLCDSSWVILWFDRLVLIVWVVVNIDFWVVNVWDSCGGSSVNGCMVLVWWFWFGLCCLCGGVCG